MSWFLRASNADALLYSLVSTQRLTFFYWDQDRLASLLPLLVWPIRDPLWNFYALMALQGVAFFALVLVFVRFHLGQASKAISPAVLSISVLVTGLLSMMLLVPEANYWFIFEQQYGFATLLFLVGIGSLMNGAVIRQVTGGFLVVASVLVIPSSVLMAPFAWLLGTAETRRRRFLITVGVVLLAFSINKVATIVSSDSSGRSSLYTDFSLRRLFRLYDVTFTNIRNVVDTKFFVLLAAQSCLVLVARRQHIGPTLRRAYLAVPAFAFGWFVLFSANGWVEEFAAHPRYFFPLFVAAIFLLSGAVAEVIGMLARSAPAPMRVSAIAPMAVAAGLSLVPLSLGLSNLRRDDGIPVIATAFTQVNAARPFEVDFIVGSYWSVWPAVLVARSENLDVLGVAQRSQTIRTDILDQVEERRPNVTVMCLEVDIDTCVRDFSAFVDEAWSPSAVVLEDPLVLDLQPTDEP